MILSDNTIIEEITKKNIIIEPFDIKNLGSNSYDVHLGNTLGVYKDTLLDAKKHNEIDLIDISGVKGYELQPGVLYLATTQEYTETHNHIPFLEGKSSTGRLGINIHATAGKGDIGFCGYWTLELSCIQPVIIYAGMPIAQLIYFTTDNVNTSYKDKKSAKYNNILPIPIESMMWKNKF